MSEAKTAFGAPSKSPLNLEGSWVRISAMPITQFG
jgi:hypothetical protein